MYKKKWKMFAEWTGKKKLLLGSEERGLANYNHRSEYFTNCRQSASGKFGSFGTYSAHSW